ncbi:acetyl-CoA carboxylase [Opitutaceae bacterium TAV5]|nr:acetyl-CoA carboxylase [Opitutaceae bacterium TAV5]
MDLKQIKQLIDLMKRSDLTEFSVEEEDFKIKICRAAGTAASGNTANPFPVFSAPAPQAAPAAPVAAPETSATSAAAAGGGEEAGVTWIKSPMVGTFYRASSPESKPFAEPGTKVVENSVVCIIEAMKIMNEIQAELKGTIVEALVENGQPVEYGQRLFKVKQG